MGKNPKRKVDRSWIDALPPIEIQLLEFSATEGPSCDTLPDAIGYSDRGPDDFVVSGPLGSGRGPGRSFPDMDAARAFVQEQYGDRVLGGAGGVKCTMMPQNLRWFAIIRGVPRDPNIEK